MNLPTREEIFALESEEACQRLIKELDREYDFSHTVIIYTDNIDRVVNALVLLEFRLKELQVTATAIYANECKAEKKLAEPVVEHIPRRKGKLPRKFRVMETIYDDIFQAARVTGIKLDTLKAYVSRKPERYGYIEHEKE